MGKEENRKFARIDVGLPVVYANLRLSGKDAYHYFKSAIVNISEGGLGMVVEDPVEQGDLLQILLTLPVRPFVITGLARGAWVRKPTGDEGYQVGLEFIRTPLDLDQSLIDQLKAQKS